MVQSLSFRRGLLVWFRLSFPDQLQLQKSLRLAWRSWRRLLRFYCSLRHFCWLSLSSFCLLGEPHIWVAWCRWGCSLFPNSFLLRCIPNSWLNRRTLDFINGSFITIHFVQLRVIACAYHSRYRSSITGCICYFCFVYIESQSSHLAGGSVGAAAFAWCGATCSA